MFPSNFSALWIYIRLYTLLHTPLGPEGIIPSDACFTFPVTLNLDNPRRQALQPAMLLISSILFPSKLLTLAMHWADSAPIYLFSSVIIDYSHFNAYSRKHDLSIDVTASGIFLCKPKLIRDPETSICVPLVLVLSRYDKPWSALKRIPASTLTLTYM